MRGIKFMDWIVTLMSLRSIICSASTNPAKVKVGKLKKIDGFGFLDTTSEPVQMQTIIPVPVFHGVENSLNRSKKSASRELTQKILSAKASKNVLRKKKTRSKAIKRKRIKVLTMCPWSLMKTFFVSMYDPTCEGKIEPPKIRLPSKKSSTLR
jgi:hypothetical protein